MAAFQVTPAEPGSNEAATVAYVPNVTDSAVSELRRLAEAGPVIAFSPVPALLRDALALPAIAIEQVPGALLSAFPRLIAGL